MNTIDDKVDGVVVKEKRYATFVEEIFNNKRTIVEAVNGIRTERDCSTIGDMLLNAYNPVISIGEEEHQEYRDALDMRREVKWARNKVVGKNLTEEEAEDRIDRFLSPIKSHLTTYWTEMNGVCTRSGVTDWYYKPEEIKYCEQVNLAEVINACRNIMIHADEGIAHKHNLEKMRVVLIYLDECGYSSFSEEPQQIVDDFKNRVYNPYMWKIALMAFDVLSLNKASNLRWRTFRSDIGFKDQGD